MHYSSISSMLVFCNLTVQHCCVKTLICIYTAMQVSIVVKHL